MSKNKKFWMIEIRNQSYYGSYNHTKYVLQVVAEKPYTIMAPFYAGRLNIDTVDDEKAAFVLALAKKVGEWVSPSYDYIMGNIDVAIKQGANHKNVDVLGFNPLRLFQENNRWGCSKAVTKTHAMMVEDGRLIPNLEDAIRWLILNSEDCRSNVQVQEVRRIASFIISEYSGKVASFSDACARIFPMRAQWGKEALKILMFDGDFINGKMSNPNYRQMRLAEGYVFQTLANNGVKGFDKAHKGDLPDDLKDVLMGEITAEMAAKVFESAEEKKKFPSGDLPINVKTFADFAKTLTVEQYLSLVNLKEITSRTSGAMAVMIAEDHLIKSDGLEFDVSLARGVEAYHKFATLNIDKVNAENLMEVNLKLFKLVNNSELHNFYASMCSYIEGEGADSLTLENVMNAFSAFEANVAWISSPENANYIVGKILKLGGYKQVFYVLRDVRESTDRLTVAQWNKYIANYKEVKDMPYEWWGNMIL